MPKDEKVEVEGEDVKAEKPAAKVEAKVEPKMDSKVFIPQPAVAVEAPAKPMDETIPGGAYLKKVDDTFVVIDCDGKVRTDCTYDKAAKKVVLKK